MTTPPGWYPDPGQMPQLPPQERWWDGNSWTGHTRPGAGAVPQPGRGGAGTGRGQLIAGIVGSVVLAAALAVGGVLLLGGGSDDKNSDDKKPKAAPSSSATPDESAPPEDEKTPSPDTSPGDVVPEPELGVGLKVPEGWEQANPDSGFLSHKTAYVCPGQNTNCVRGGAQLLPVSSGWEGKKALKEATELQVAKNAKESYSKKAYGGITSHKVVKSGAVTVAGQPGYRIRWRVENKLEPDAYVEAAVFRSPHLEDEILTLWSSADIAPKSPPPSDLDELRKSVVKTGLGEGGEGNEGDDGNQESV
ncbi:DUF2510 domain-containing protein [Streptomyces sp. CA-250714]|uniref:DUF2510 domain-containing protein n=1 Tax=Streptomyces sp. CA-250714 TaxID=3240060 RepID=UPI003D8CF1E1